MVSVNEKRKLQLIAGLFPLLISFCAVINQSWTMLIVYALSLFLTVGVVPLFRKRESLYMFVLVGLTGLPVNIRLIYWLISEEIIGLDFLIGDILWGGLLFCVFFSVEEIVFGIVARMIWKRQYKIKL